LAGNQQQLRVQDAIPELVTHGNAGGPEPVQQGLISRKLQLCTQLDREPHRHAGLMSPDDFVSKFRKLNKVKSHIDPGSLIADEIEDGGVTVLE
jgi:hypothetical protein